jgi:hypothetical protein
MEFEKFIGGKFKMFTLPYMLLKRFHENFLLPGATWPWASHYLSLVLMLCNLRQDTFIDYLIAFTGLWPGKSLHFFMLCSLG